MHFRDLIKPTITIDDVAIGAGATYTSGRLNSTAIRSLTIKWGSDDIWTTYAPKRLTLVVREEIDPTGGALYGVSKLAYEGKLVGSAVTISVRLIGANIYEGTVTDVETRMDGKYVDHYLTAVDKFTEFLSRSPGEYLKRSTGITTKTAKELVDFIFRHAALDRNFGGRFKLVNNAPESMTLQMEGAPFADFDDIYSQPPARKDLDRIANSLILGYYDWDVRKNQAIFSVPMALSPLVALRMNPVTQYFGYIYFSGFREALPLTMLDGSALEVSDPAISTNAEKRLRHITVNYRKWVGDAFNEKFEDVKAKLELDSTSGVEKEISSSAIVAKWPPPPGSAYGHRDTLARYFEKIYSLPTLPEVSFTIDEEAPLKYGWPRDLVEYWMTTSRGQIASIGSNQFAPLLFWYGDSHRPPPLPLYEPIGGTLQFSKSEWKITQNLVFSERAYIDQTPRWTKYTDIDRQAAYKRGEQSKAIQPELSWQDIALNYNES